MNESVVAALAAAAKARGIEPAALLALVEVETAGRPFEQDGRTPHFLYERHVAYKMARARGVLPAFVRAGLAHPTWSPATQYRDQRTSAQRLELLDKACAIDHEVAAQACSWGLGQTMGFLAPELGFGSAVELVRHDGTIEGQIDCLLRELEHSHLVESLNAHDWEHVARVYNGAGYKRNAYDAKLADAYKRNARRVVTVEGSSPAPALSEPQIVRVQTELRDLGYHEVGAVDGRMGSRTVAAIAAFQHHEGLPITGKLDDATEAALESAEARPVPRERSEATTDDLRDSGSRTIAHTDRISLWGKIKLWLGIGAAGGGLGEQSGLLGQAQELADQADQAKGLLGTVHELAAPILAHPLAIYAGLFLIGSGVLVWFLSNQIARARLEDHRTGRHPGAF